MAGILNYAASPTDENEAQHNIVSRIKVEAGEIRRACHSCIGVGMFTCIKPRTKQTRRRTKVLSSVHPGTGERRHDFL